MKHLTDSEFKKYIESIYIINNTAYDSGDEVCSVYPVKSKCLFNKAFYNECCYDLTDDQKTKIVYMIEEDLFINKSEPFEEMTNFEFYTNIY